MRRFHVEIATGIFLVLGLVSLGYLSIKFGRNYAFGRNTYLVHATFSNAAELNPGTDVKIAGVAVGEVAAIELQDYQAKVTMRISESVELREDAIAAIKTQGLIGENFISISPGGARTKIDPGGRIRDTQPAVNLRDLISRFMFKSDNEL